MQAQAEKLLAMVSTFKLAAGKSRIGRIWKAWLPTRVVTRCRRR
jgi:hypothetical protein